MKEFTDEEIKEMYGYFITDKEIKIFRHGYNMGAKDENEN